MSLLNSISTCAINITLLTESQSECIRQRSGHVEHEVELRHRQERQPRRDVPPQRLGDGVLEVKERVKDEQSQHCSN